MVADDCGLLSFLDLLLRHEEDGSISTLMYRNPTHTDSYFDLSTQYLQAHKAAVVYSLMSRTQSLLSSILSQTDEEVRITTALQSNGYPLKFIRSVPDPTGAVPDNDVTYTSTSIVLPYIKGASEGVRQFLALIHVRTIFRLAHILHKSLGHVKMSIPLNRRHTLAKPVDPSSCI